MRPADLTRMRFAYSPLTEAAESLYMLHSGSIPPVHEAWFAMTKHTAKDLDHEVLRAAVPARGAVANFLLDGATDANTTIDQQLDQLLACPPERLRQDLMEVWGGSALPPAARALTKPGGVQRLADALQRYWVLAIEPFWPQIRALLDADVAYRAARLAQGGIQALLSDLHHALHHDEDALHIAGRVRSEHDLSGAGVVLIPCAFAWPYLLVDPRPETRTIIAYGPRSVGTLWSDAAQPVDDDALGALLGRNRAAILLSTGMPKSTTDLARELGQSAPAVSAHLAVLRRSGLVSSWRSGRRVLYQRTPLATSVIAASDGGHEASASGPA